MTRDVTRQVAATRQVTFDLVREMPKTAARNIIEAIGATRPGQANLTRAALSQVMAYH